MSCWGNAFKKERLLGLNTFVANTLYFHIESIVPYFKFQIKMNYFKNLNRLEAFDELKEQLNRIEIKYVYFFISK